MGYSGDYVVGVWVGNDDNSPLAAISGGGVPARIWRDFMKQALGEANAPKTRKPSARPDPTGPIEPLDLPNLSDVPIFDGTNLRLRDGRAVFSTDIEGFPVDIRIGPDGVDIDAEEARREAEERARTMAERGREATERERERIEQ